MNAKSGCGPAMDSATTDGAAIPAGLRPLAENLPHARYVEFENSGHFVYLDEPDRFARAVTAFIKSTR
jgi:pimeloyl-ACP methyl ester carboxylesterase